MPFKQLFCGLIKLSKNVTSFCISVCLMFGLNQALWLFRHFRFLSIFLCAEHTHTYPYNFQFDFNSLKAYGKTSLWPLPPKTTHQSSIYFSSKKRKGGGETRKTSEIRRTWFSTLMPFFSWQPLTIWHPLYRSNSPFITPLPPLISLRISVFLEYTFCSHPSYIPIVYFIKGNSPWPCLAQCPSPTPRLIVQSF